MWHYPSLVLVSCKELRYICFVINIHRYTDELILAPKIMTFFCMLPSVDKNSEREWNPLPWPSYLYLCKSAFLVGLQAQISNYLCRKYINKGWCKKALWFSYIFNIFFWHCIKFPRICLRSTTKIFNAFFSWYKY